MDARRCSSRSLSKARLILPSASVKTVVETNISYRLASTGDAITFLAPDRREMSDRSAAKLPVAGNAFLSYRSFGLSISHQNSQVMW